MKNVSEDETLQCAPQWSAECPQTFLFIPRQWFQSWNKNMFLRVVSHWFKGDISISSDLFFSAVPLMQPFWETQRGKLGSPSLSTTTHGVLQCYSTSRDSAHPDMPFFTLRGLLPACPSLSTKGQPRRDTVLLQVWECSLVCQNSCEWRWELFWKCCANGAGKRGKRVHEQETHSPCKSIWFQCMLVGSDLFLHCMDFTRIKLRKSWDLNSASFKQNAISTQLAMVALPLTH